jgi:hypothetical protein
MFASASCLHSRQNRLEQQRQLQAGLAKRGYEGRSGVRRKGLTEMAAATRAGMTTDEFKHQGRYRVGQRALAIELHVESWL